LIWVKIDRCYVYSIWSLTTLTFTTGNGVHDFVMDEKGDFHLTAENINIPDGKILCARGSFARITCQRIQKFISSLENDGYKLRFSGSFVADMHQILHKAVYSHIRALREKRKGKLRLLFEANPMGR